MDGKRKITSVDDVLFNKRAGVIYRVLNHEATPSGFRPNKTRPGSLLNGFKNIPLKACPSGVQTKVQRGEH